MYKIMNRIVALAVIFCLVFEQSGFAQVPLQLQIPSYIGGYVAPDRARPMQLRSLSFDPAAQDFNQFLDGGDEVIMNRGRITRESRQLMRYFRIGLALPNDMFWVNLRPDAPDRIIDANLERTDVGRIMLAADLQLKKDLAAFTSPDTAEGRQYWDRLYARAEELFGAQRITIPTLTRPWIVPGEIIARETDAACYILKAALQVCMEQDSIKAGDTYKLDDPRSKELNALSSRLIRELILPKLTREVNSSRKYAALRQVYYSLILAQWFKEKYRGSRGDYARSIDSLELDGLTSDTRWNKKGYFDGYKRSFKKGEYNISERHATARGASIRQYVSGGMKLALTPASKTVLGPDPAAAGVAGRIPEELVADLVRVLPDGTVKVPAGMAFDGGVAEAVLPFVAQNPLISAVGGGIIGGVTALFPLHRMAIIKKLVIFLGIYFGLGCVLAFTGLWSYFWPAVISSAVGYHGALYLWKRYLPVQYAVFKLRDEERDERAWALEQIRLIGGDRRVDILIRALNNDFSDIRMFAAVYLGDLADRRAVEPLMKILGGADQGLAMDAAEALGKIGDTRAVPALMQVADSDSVAASPAVVALGLIRDARAVEVLSAIVGRANPALGVSAAAALGKIGDTRAVEPLIKALRDAHGDVRVAAASALGLLKDGRAVEPLIEYLGVSRNTAAVRALGAIGDARAIDPLIKAAGISHELAACAAEALAQFGARSQAAVPVLRKALSEMQTEKKEKQERLQNTEKQFERSYNYGQTEIEDNPEYIALETEIADIGNMISAIQKSLALIPPAQSPAPAVVVPYQRPAFPPPAAPGLNMELLDIVRTDRHIFVGHIRDERVLQFFLFLSKHELTNIVLTGGAIRDIFFGRQSNDLDITVKIPLTDQEREDSRRDSMHGNQRMLDAATAEIRKLTDALGISPDKLMRFGTDSQTPMFEGMRLQYIGPIQQEVAPGRTVILKRALVDSTTGEYSDFFSNVALSELALDVKSNLYGNYQALDDLWKGEVRLKRGEQISLDMVLRLLRMKYEFGLTIVPDDYDFIRGYVREQVQKGAPLPEKIRVPLRERVQGILETARDRNAAEQELAELGYFTLIARQAAVPQASVIAELEQAIAKAKENKSPAVAAALENALMAEKENVRRKTAEESRRIAAEIKGIEDKISGLDAEMGQIDAVDPVDMERIQENIAAARQAYEQAEGKAAEFRTALLAARKNQKHAVAKALEVPAQEAGIAAAEAKAEFTRANDGLSGLRKKMEIAESVAAPLREEIAALNAKLAGLKAEKAKLDLSLGGTSLETQKDGGTTPVGGIDFHALPVTLPPAGPAIAPGVMPRASLKDLGHQWAEVQRKANNAELPYEQMKSLVSSCKSQEDAAALKQEVTAYVVNLLKLEEERAIATPERLKEIVSLVVA